MQPKDWALSYRAAPFSLVSFLILIALFGGIIAGFQALGQSRDAMVYDAFYESIVNFRQASNFRFEQGFTLTAVIFKHGLHADREFFFSALAAMALLIKFSIFSVSRRPILTALFYMCCWFPLHEYTQIRAAVGVSFVMLAAEAFFKQRFYIFAALVSVGFLFHGSALMVGMAIPLAWALTYFSTPAMIAAVVVLGSLIIVYLPLVLEIATVINSTSSIYINGYFENSVNLFSTTNLCVIALLVLMLLSKSHTDRRKKSFFVLVLFGLMLAVTFQSVPVFSHRIREIFMIFLVPLVFNCRRTPLGIAEMSLTVVLAVGYLHSYLDQGLIGT